MLALIVLGCAFPEDPKPVEGVGVVDSAPPEPEPLVCADAGDSVCGNPAAIIRGFVQLAPGLKPTSTRGDLFLALTHAALGGGDTGGYYHVHTVVPDVDLAGGPVEFAFDMCDGGEMWSEENCGYNLIAILDTDGSNGARNLLSDPGEAATRIEIDVSCRADSPCHTVTLDCTAGSDCIAFDAATECSCDAESCASPITTCQ